MAETAGLDSADIVDLETFRTEGHRRHLGRPEITSDYDALKTQLMEDAALHAGMPVIRTSVELATWGKKYQLPHGYLSTRPASIGEATYQNLQGHGFGAAPMLLRHKDIPYGDTIGYKARALDALRSTLDLRGLYESTIYFVDDYPQLVEHINELGTNIVGITFDNQTSWRRVAHDHFGVTIPES